MTAPSLPGPGSLSPDALVPARLAQHFAAQPLAAAAYALLPMTDDHSHATLEWDAERWRYLGRPLGSSGRAFLDLSELRIGLLDEAGGEAVSIALAGKTLDDGFAAFASALRERGADVPADGLRLPEWDLPESGLTAGEPFPEPDEAFVELARWNHFASAALRAIAREELEGAPLLLWAHHFDTAALQSFPATEAAPSGRFLGAGFSPGDGSYAEPYFYVSPWPAPAPDALPALTSGAHWHTEGFTSAVLTASAILGAAGDDAQRALVLGSLRESITHGRALIGS